MKKYLFLLLLVPLISFGHTPKLGNPEKTYNYGSTFWYAEYKNYILSICSIDSSVILRSKKTRKIVHWYFEGGYGDLKPREVEIYYRKMEIAMLHTPRHPPLFTKNSGIIVKN